MPTQDRPVAQVHSAVIHAGLHLPCINLFHPAKRDQQVLNHMPGNFRMRVFAPKEIRGHATLDPMNEWARWEQNCILFDLPPGLFCSGLSLGGQIQTQKARFDPILGINLMFLELRAKVLLLLLWIEVKWDFEPQGTGSVVTTVCWSPR